MQATIYLAALGPSGLKNCAEQCFHKAHYAAQKLSEVGCEIVFQSPFFHEFAIRAGDIAATNQKLREAGMIGGYDLGRDYPELAGAMLLCCTEQRTRAEIDALADALRNEKYA